MRNLMAGLLLAMSILAHGFWRAGSKLHHMFGAMFLGFVTVIILPIAVVKRAFRDRGKRPDTKDE